MSAVGLIGLGNMGIPMAAHLLKAGYEVVGYRRGDASDFRALGGTVASSARDVANKTKVVLSCIPDDQSLEDIVSGPEGITSTDCQGLTLVELSTLSDHVSREQASALSSRGATMLDGAISGLPPMLTKRTATFLLSGDDAAFHKVRPCLELMTDHLHFMGSFGAASKAKLCANMLVAANIASTAETLAFGAKAGLDQLKLLEVLEESAGTSLQLKARGKRMATGDWNEVLGSTSMLTKDVHLIEATADRISCPVPILNAIAKVYESAVECGYANTDVASVYGSVARSAGLKVPVKPTE